MAAKARGNLAVGGPAFEAWFGVLPDITTELLRMIKATF